MGIGANKEMQYSRASAITYNTKHHLGILFQFHGSVWRHVIHICIVNCIITFVVIFLQQQGIDLTFKDNGHKFMSVLVSFLVVSRNSIVYSRYMEARSYLGSLFRASSELVQNAAVITQNDQSKGIKEWRTEIARQTIVLLEVTLAFLSYRSQGINAWDSAVGITETEKIDLKKLVSLRSSILDNAIGDTAEEMNGETPILLMYNLRKLIANYKKYGFEFDVPILKELKLYTYIDTYAVSFYGLKRLITTPFPFPLVQMARTFLAFWLFTIPFAMVNDMGEKARLADIAIIFFLTYGYAGLELVSMEMDDPFGEDDNDFKHKLMAEAVFEDIYLVIYDVCGGMEASQLRRMFGEVTESYRVAEKAGHHRKATEIDDSVLVVEDSMVELPMPEVEGSRRNVSFVQKYSFRRIVNSEDEEESEEDESEYYDSKGTEV